MSCHSLFGKALLVFAVTLAGPQARAQKLGVWLYGSDGAVYALRVGHKRVGYRLEPFIAESAAGTSEGVSYYPLIRTQTLDGVPEHDPVSGKYLGPAIRRSHWDRFRQVLRSEYSNGYYRSTELQLKPPAFLSGAKLEDALLDHKANVFWVKRDLSGQFRIYHQNYELKSILVNELVVGQKIRKVRGNAEGTGLNVLLESGQLLDVVIDEFESLEVTNLNDPLVSMVLDFEVGPLSGRFNEFHLVTQSWSLKKNAAEIAVQDPFDPKKFEPVALDYVSPIQPQFRIPLKGPIHLTGNIHATDAKLLLSSTPDQLNRFFQVQYEAQQKNIRRWAELSSIERPAADLTSPGICRYYFTSVEGLSQMLYQN